MNKDDFFIFYELFYEQVLNGFLSVKQYAMINFTNVNETKKGINLGNTFKTLPILFL